MFESIKTSVTPTMDLYDEIDYRINALPTEFYGARPYKLRQMMSEADELFRVAQEIYHAGHKSVQMGKNIRMINILRNKISSYALEKYPNDF